MIIIRNLEELDSAVDRCSRLSREEQLALKQRVREKYAKGETVYVVFSEAEIGEIGGLAEEIRKDLAEVLRQPGEVAAVCHHGPKREPPAPGFYDAHGNFHSTGGGGGAGSIH